MSPVFPFDSYMHCIVELLCGLLLSIEKCFSSATFPSTLCDVTLEYICVMWPCIIWGSAEIGRCIFELSARCIHMMDPVANSAIAQLICISIGICLCICVCNFVCICINRCLCWYFHLWWPCSWASVGVKANSTMALLSWGLIVMPFVALLYGWSCI